MNRLTNEQMEKIAMDHASRNWLTDYPQSIESVCNAAIDAAASPELLSIAKSVAAFGYHTLFDETPCLCSRCELVHEARAAIARALPQGASE